MSDTSIDKYLKFKKTIINVTVNAHMYSELSFSNLAIIDKAYRNFIT